MVDEAESRQLQDLVLRTRAVSCTLLRTELRRAASRVTTVDVLPLAEEVLAGTRLVAVDEAMLDRAGSLAPVSLRSLDAIHIAAALVVAEEISAVVTYDARMAAAARFHGFEVWSPGQQR